MTIKHESIARLIELSKIVSPEDLTENEINWSFWPENNYGSSHAVVNADEIEVLSDALNLIKSGDDE